MSDGVGYRLALGGLVDRAAPISFRFDGVGYTGFVGDTLASALLANGVRLVGRSFKYHRPRGVVTAGPEEPNALVELGVGARREPNIAATVIGLFEGLEARSQNRFPSLRVDFMAVNGLLGPLFGAGFYYKTFMWPASFWERVYEPLIRRAAGLGRAAVGADPDVYYSGHLHADVLVVGGGPAGLAAALAAGRAGARVVLVDEDRRLGGRLLAERDGRLDGVGAVDELPGPEWAAQAVAELQAMPGVRVMARTHVFGAYDHGTFGAVEDRGGASGPGLGPGAEVGARQCYWRIVARHCVLAAGAIERPLVFPGNDRPGVMLAGAVRAYLNRFGVAPGRRAVVVTAGEDGWRTVADLEGAGVAVAAVVDRRADAGGRGSGDGASGGARVFGGGYVASTSGRLGVRSVQVVDGAGRSHRIEADLVAMAGGWTPSVALAAQLGGRPVWDEATQAFLARSAETEGAPGAPGGMRVVGAAAGRFGLAAGLRDGWAAGCAVAAELGLGGLGAGGEGLGRLGTAPVGSSEDVATGNPPVWLMPRAGGKAFVDFQHDVTADDVELAHREGFRSVEHLKRYTTLGMATDQGKLSNVTGLAVMAALMGRGIDQAGTTFMGAPTSGTTFKGAPTSGTTFSGAPTSGTTMFRAPVSPVAIGALAGRQVGADLQPTRLTPGHDWAVARGAVMVEAGAWLRAGWFPRDGEDWLAACTREVRATRGAAGLCDVSSLGKIELVGPDVGAFLDRLYINGISGLAVGRVRYGVMLREDGFVFDDGTVARLEAERWLVTTTTAHAGAVLTHMEFCHQVLWPELRVGFATVTDQWAQFSLAGPRAREILARVVGGGVEALPYMGCGVFGFAGRVARVFRISFSGELAYEIAVPARHAGALLAALFEAGAPLGLVPYGLEALSVMRIEKGHPAGAELNGQTTAGDLGLGRMMSGKKDFVGRAMAGRPALVDAARPALVGLRPIGAGARVRGGAHLFDRDVVPWPENDLGWVTSAAYSPSLGQWIGLGMLKSGRDRLGDCIRSYDPIRNGDVLVEVVSTCFVDPEGRRLRD